jgi:hypothetical protein
MIGLICLPFEEHQRNKKCAETDRSLLKLASCASSCTCRLCCGRNTTLWPASTNQSEATGRQEEARGAEVVGCCAGFKGLVIVRRLYLLLRCVLPTSLEFTVN